MLAALNSESLRCKAMVYLSIDTGIREGELTGLLWSDIDFIKGKLTISKQRQYVSGYGEYICDPKSESGNRTITLSVTVNKMLRQYMELQQYQFSLIGEIWSNDGFVFVHEDGRKIHPSYPYRWFTDFLKRHSLPKITYHQLRHTNASLSIAAGLDVATLSGRLGHADKNVTLGTYTHIIKSKEEQAANCMDIFYSQATLNESETE
jgi:integrase